MTKSMTTLKTWLVMRNLFWSKQVPSTVLSQKAFKGRHCTAQAMMMARPQAQMRELRAKEICWNLGVVKTRR